MGDDYLYYGTTDFTGVNTNNPLIVRNRIEFLDEDLKKRFKFVEKHIFPEYPFLIFVDHQNSIERGVQLRIK